MSVITYRAVPGFVGYRVGSDGTLWSCRTSQGTTSSTWRQIHGRPDKDGYPVAVLSQRGQRTHMRLSHAVLIAFKGPRPKGSEARHFPDPDPRNNRVDNLQWSSHVDNIADKTTMGTIARGESHGCVRLSASQVREIRRRAAAGETRTALAREFGISVGHASGICLRKYWSHL